MKKEKSDLAMTKRSRFRKATLWSLGFVAVILFAIVGVVFSHLRSFDNGPLPPNLNSIAQLPVTLADGRRVLLGDNLKAGIPTVITMWASWCGPCRMEAPKIAELRREFANDKLNLVYLNVRDPDASRENLARYMTDFGMAPEAYAVLDDAHITTLTNASDNLVPRTLLFDKAGAPVAMITGYKPLALARISSFISG